MFYVCLSDSLPDLQLCLTGAFGSPVPPVYPSARRDRSEASSSLGCLQFGKFRAFGALIIISVPLSILLIAAIGAKLKGPHGGLQVGKWAVHDEQTTWNDTT